MAASASSDQTVRLWDLATGRCLAIARGDSPWRVLALAGAALAAGNENGTVAMFAILGLDLGWPEVPEAIPDCWPSFFGLAVQSR
jgi:WD40 repeat protein